MACFTVPLATAAAVSAAGKALPESVRRNPFAARLDWLVKMLAGGSLLLAVEHWMHGEITLLPPFLTAAKEGPEAVAEMLREMATSGSAMALLVTAAWATAVTISTIRERARTRATSNV